MDTLHNDTTYPKAETSKSAMASFILGICSYVGLFPLALVSIVCGIIGLRNVKKYDLLGGKEAKIGIILSVVNIILSAIILFAFIFGTGAIFSSIIGSATKETEVAISNEMGNNVMILYAEQELEYGYSKCPPELEPYVGTRIILTDETFAQLPASLQKALSTHLDSVKCPQPVYRPTGKEQYAIEVREYSFRIYVINDKKEWETFPLTTTLY